MSNCRRRADLAIRRLSAVLLAAALTLSWQAQASAHHGWGHFDTARPLHVGGEVVAVRWGNPHPEVHLRVDRGLPVPEGLASMPIPTELEKIGGRDVLRVTRPYEGASRELHLILAPTSRLEAWGMPDEVSEGEQIRTVGYVGRDDGQEFRPELWLETTAVAEALRTSAWGSATAEALHLTGTLLLVGPQSSSTSGF